MFAKEGYSNIAATVILVVILCITGFYASGWVAYIIFTTAGLLLAFILFFFRDPDRNVPDDPNLILAPADGKILSIKDVEEPIYIQGKARQISIFLSGFDVHVNRLPASGTVEYLKYNPGVYLMAWNDDASTMNERADFGVLHKTGIRIFFRQITGFMARRIVYHINEGDQVIAGDRFGMMKFGSRMDILIPAHIKLNVQEGDCTIGGETILAHLSSL